MLRFCGRAAAVLMLTCASASAFSQTTTYSYDALGRVTRAKEGDGRQVVYKYDAAGNRLELSNGAPGIELEPVAFSASSNGGGFSGLGAPASMRDLSFQGVNSAHITQAQGANWITADLGAEKLINHVDIAPPDRSLTGGGVQALNSALLEYSLDGSVWTPGPTIGGASPGVYSTLTLGGVQARYVRLRKAGAALGVGDFRLYSAVKPTNRSPVASDISRVKLNKDEPFSINVAVLASDPDGDTPTVTAVSAAQHGATSFTAAGVSHVPIAGFVGTDGFSYTVADGRGGFATGTVALQYNAPPTSGSNRPPIATDDGGPNARIAIPYAAGWSTPIIRVLDNDSDPDGDTLSIASAGPVQHGYLDTSQGTIRYFPAADGFNGVEDFPYTVSDGRGGSATGRVWVRIGNNYPETTQDSVATSQNTGVNVWPLVNDHDADGDPLVIGAYTQPAHGALTKASDTLLVYTPHQDYVGADSFTYTARDTQGANGGGNVFITVNAGPPASTNNAPVAQNDFSAADPASVPFNTTVMMMVLSNDGDPEGDTITISSFAPPAHGSLTRVSTYPEHLRYSPTSGYSGPDSFSYTISDGRGGNATATAYVRVGGDPAHAPQAVNDGPYSVVKDGEILLTDLLANDSEPDGDPMTITRTVGPSHGQAAILNGSTIRYRPNLGYVGQERFYYVVEDNHGISGGAFVTIDIVAPNRSPSAANDGPVSTWSSTATTIDVLANDTDPDNDPLTITAVTSPAHGSAVMAGGKITYTAAAGYSGADSFGYTVSDGKGATALATVTLTVQFSPNRTPVAVADVAAATYGEATVIDVLANDSDPDGDGLTIASVAQPNHGLVVIANGKVTYTPASGYSGSDSFTYVVSDGQGGSASSSVTVTVGPKPNTPPVAPNGAVTTTRLAAVNFTPSISDPDGDAVSITAVSTPAHGVATKTGNQITYTSSGYYYGADSFTYTVADAKGATTTGTVNVTVNMGAYLPPKAVDDYVSMQANGTFTLNPLVNDSADGNFLVIGTPVATHGTIWKSGNEISFWPDAGYYGQAQIAYTISDTHGQSASATIRITIAPPPNNNPVAPDGSIVTNRQYPGTVGPNASDPDGDPVTITSVSTPAHGTATKTGPNQITYLSSGYYFGADSFTYTVSDGRGGTATGTMSVNVLKGPNLPPTAVNDSVTVAKNGNVTFSPTANDSDDGGFIIIGTMTASHGVISRSGNQVTYWPEAGYVGSDQIPYIISDFEGRDASAVISITVTP